MSNEVKKKILKKIYEKTVKLEKETLTFEIQLRKITHKEEERSKDTEIPKFLADMY